MSEAQCPLCYDALQPRDVAPCHSCGHDPQEIEHFALGRHQYTVYRFLESLEITLCDHCIVDLSSFDPAWFGLKERRELGPALFTVIKVLRDPQLAVDKYCPSCNVRLAFLRFVLAVRQRSA